MWCLSSIYIMKGFPKVVLPPTIDVHYDLFLDLLDKRGIKVKEAIERQI